MMDKLSQLVWAKAPNGDRFILINRHNLDTLSKGKPTLVHAHIQPSKDGWKWWIDKGMQGKSETMQEAFEDADACRWEMEQV